SVDDRTIAAGIAVAIDVRADASIERSGRSEAGRTGNLESSRQVDGAVEVELMPLVQVVEEVLILEVELIVDLRRTAGCALVVVIRVVGRQRVVGIQDVARATVVNRYRHGAVERVCRGLLIEDAGESRIRTRSVKDAAARCRVYPGSLQVVVAHSLEARGVDIGEVCCDNETASNLTLDRCVEL